MKVNTELREEVIKEYVAKESEKSLKTINGNMKKAVIAMIAIFGVAFSVYAYMYIFVGRYQEGMMIFVGGVIVSLPVLALASLIVWLALKRSNSREAAMTEDRLRRTVCYIEDDSLVRKVVGGGRPKQFKLDKIRGLKKEGDVVSFEYGNYEIELPDYYEPTLFETLKKAGVEEDGPGETVLG